MRFRGSIRDLSRQVGLGVAEALQAVNAADEQEPGWRAERFARGAMRGIDESLEPDHLVQLSEEAARAFARGALHELRAQLGDRGNGPLTRALSASSRRLAHDAAVTVAVPMALCIGLGVTGALLLRLAQRRR